ncbi:MAG TPA: DinB family protein [Tepidisphaeraceae bacterium]|jgi:hypothetical protein|nr:DinB family protein [Tepidisphaeraceae bacterium]
MLKESTFIEDRAPMAAPLVTLLRQQASVVERLTDQQYAMRPVGPVDGSIGGHIRHCLDHVKALVTAADTGLLAYDHRKRDTQIESCRLLALGQIRELERALYELPPDAMDREIDLTTLLSPDDDPVVVRSSVGRELAYVLSHTVHHNALISAMVKTLEGWIPQHFGYAPSTIAHARATACAR